MANLSTKSIADLVEISDLRFDSYLLVEDGGEIKRVSAYAVKQAMGGGGGGFQTAAVTLTNAYGPVLPYVTEGPEGMSIVVARDINQESAEIVVPCAFIPPESGFNGITGQYIEVDGAYIITGNVTIDMEVIG